jgi:hypothetical protein
MERKNRERSEAINKENERREATKQSYEAQSLIPRVHVEISRFTGLAKYGDLEFNERVARYVTAQHPLRRAELRKIGIEYRDETRD